MAEGTDARQASASGASAGVATGCRAGMAGPRWTGPGACRGAPGRLEPRALVHFMETSRRYLMAPASGVAQT